jgi:hypothetical protein
MESNGETWEGKELYYTKHRKIRRSKPMIIIIKLMNIIIKPIENRGCDDEDFH